MVVVADPDEPPLPFADAASDLVTSRHPVAVWWTEIARVLKPGGTYFAEHVGLATVFELVEYFLGPQPSTATATGRATCTSRSRPASGWWDRSLLLQPPDSLSERTGIPRFRTGR